jgi:hypothetical protein
LGNFLAATEMAASHGGLGSMEIGTWLLGSIWEGKKRLDEQMG